MTAMAYIYEPESVWSKIGRFWTPPEGVSGWAGGWWFFRRLAMITAMAMFWYMAQFELVGPWLADRGLIGTVFGFIVSLALVGVPFWEALGLRFAAEQRGEVRWAFRVLWCVCAAMTFTGHLYLVSAKGGQDRFRQETAEETAAAMVAEGDALVSTAALEARLEDERATVRRLASEHERVQAWRAPLAQAIAGGDAVPELRAVQIEVTARRASRGESPIQEDGRALGASDCTGVCGETAEAIEREISLVGAALRDAEAARDATSGEIQERIDIEASGGRRERIAEAGRIADTETTTRNMQEFLGTLRRLGEAVGMEPPEEMSDEAFRQRAATISDLAFVALLAVLNVIAWTNSAGEGGGSSRRQRDQPMPPLPPRAPLPAPSPPAPSLPPIGAHAAPAPRVAAASSAARAGPGPDRPEPDRSRLSAEAALAALRAKNRSPRA